MSIVNNIYKNVGLIANSLYDGVSSFYEKTSTIVKSERVINTASILCLSEVNSLASYTGRKIAEYTNGYIQLNNFVPQSVRNGLRSLGKKIIVPCIKKLGLITSNILGLANSLARNIIGAPIVEELMFRLPLFLLACGIDANTGGILEDLLLYSINGADVLKGLAAVIFSVAFTYSHSNNPTPARATGLFIGGLALSAITLRSGLQGVRSSSSKST